MKKAGNGGLKLNIVFWSEEDGCGMTSGMAAIASACADLWSMKVCLMQSSNQGGDLYQKLGTGIKNISLVREDIGGRRDAWEVLIRLAVSGKLTKESLLGSMVPVARGQMYYLPQGEYKKREKYSQAVKTGIRRVADFTRQIADLTFIDCGSGKDEISDLLLSQADVTVVMISQERQNLDAFFQNRHVFQGNVVYLINQYHQESVYNKKNIHRLYRIYEEELAVIPHNPVFRQVSEKGKTERFIRRHRQCRNFDGQNDFMQELIKTTGLILKAAGMAV